MKACRNRWLKTAGSPTGESPWSRVGVRRASHEETGFRALGRRQVGLHVPEHGRGKVQTHFHGLQGRLIGKREGSADIGPGRHQRLERNRGLISLHHLGGDAGVLAGQRREAVGVDFAKPVVLVEAEPGPVGFPAPIAGGGGVARVHPVAGADQQVLGQPDFEIRIGLHAQGHDPRHQGRCGRGSSEVGRVVRVGERITRPRVIVVAIRAHAVGRGDLQLVGTKAGGGGRDENARAKATVGSEGSAAGQRRDVDDIRAGTLASPVGVFKGLGARVAGGDAMNGAGRG